jgi:Lon protease-like protein
MADLEHFDELPDTFPGVVRLFPLPDLVLFPGAVQPLRVFEPRYRELLEESLAEDKIIAMATLNPGWQTDYDGRPDIWPFVCLGRVVANSSQPSGESNILLAGVRRARVTHELPAERSFRQATVELVNDEYPQQSAARRGELRLRLINCFREYLSKSSVSHKQFDQLLATDVSLGLLADIVAFTLNLDLETKKQLLGKGNVDERVEHLLGQIAPGTQSISTEAHPFPPPFSEN